MATVFSVARCVNHIARLSTRPRPRASNSRQAPALALSMASASPPPPGGDGWVLPCKVKSSPYDFIVNELDASGQVLALGDHAEPHVPAELSAGAVSAAAAAAATSMAWTASTDAAAATFTFRASSQWQDGMFNIGRIGAFDHAGETDGSRPEPFTIEW